MTKFIAVCVMTCLAATLHRVTSLNAMSRMPSVEEKKPGPVSFRNMFPSGFGQDVAQHLRQIPKPTTSSTSAVESSNKSTTSPMKKFGCTFENEEYFVPTKSIFDSVYGTEVEPMDFASLTEFQDFISRLNKEYSNFLNEIVYTNIPDFYDLYNQYRANKERNLTTFYKDYVPKFFARHGDASMAVELLDRMVKLNPKMSNSVQLIPCSINAEKKLLDQLEIELEGESQIPQTKTNPSSGKQEPPKTLFHHRHVAALFKIRLEGSRLGYVIMDPVFSVENPVVIVEDGKAPHLPKGGKDWKFYLAREDYVFVKYDAGESGDDHYLYYIGKPYCSFLMTTTKPHTVILTSKGIARSDSTGLTLAAISFTFYNEGPMAFDLLVHSSVSNKTTDRNRRYESDRIPFGTLKDLENNPNKNLQQHFKSVLETIHYEGLTDLLHTAENIAKDKQFVEDYVELNKYVMESFKNHTEGDLPF